MRSGRKLPGIELVEQPVGMVLQLPFRCGNRRDSRRGHLQCRGRRQDQYRHR